MPRAIGWAPALLPSRGGVIARPRLNPGNLIREPARCDWEIEEVAEAALLPVAPTLRSGKLDRPVKYRFFGRSNFLAIRDYNALKRGIEHLPPPFSSFRCMSALHSDATRQDLSTHVAKQDEGPPIRPWVGRHLASRHEATASGGEGRLSRR
jgi:hypothetical protein